MKILSPASDPRSTCEYDHITGLICDRCDLRSANANEQGAGAPMSAFTSIDVRMDGLLRRADLCPACASTNLLQFEAWPASFRVLGECNSPNGYPRKYCFTAVDAKTDHAISCTSLLDEGWM